MPVHENPSLSKLLWHIHSDDLGGNVRQTLTIFAQGTPFSLRKTKEGGTSFPLRPEQNKNKGTLFSVHVKTNQAVGRHFL